MQTPSWKRIEEFPDYDVSDGGLVRSWRADLLGRPTKRMVPHEMRPFTTSLGYKQVMLREPGKSKPHRRLIHRLVAKAFLANPDNLPDVAHEDGCPSNNGIRNLRWPSHQENQMDMRRHGTMQDGEKCITAKLTSEQVA